MHVRAHVDVWLCGVCGCTDPMFAPAELLVALHALNPTRDAIPTKALTAAVDAALKSPNIFPQHAVAQVG